MIKSIQLMLTTLGFTGLSLAQIFYLPLLPQNDKAFANPQNTLHPSTEQKAFTLNNPMNSCFQIHSIAASTGAMLASKSQPEQKIALKSIGSDNHFSIQHIAQANSLIYLGQVGGAEVYRESGTGLIIVFLYGLQFVYNTISSAISFISSSIQANTSGKRCQFQGEFVGTPNSTQKSCAYKCKGYGALATFPWPRNQPCPPSFDGNFPGP